MSGEKRVYAGDLCWCPFTTPMVHHFSCVKYIKAEGES